MLGFPFACLMTASVLETIATHHVWVQVVSLCISRLGAG